MMVIACESLSQAKFSNQNTKIAPGTNKNSLPPFQWFFFFFLELLWGQGLQSEGVGGAPTTLLTYCVTAVATASASPSAGGSIVKLYTPRCHCCNGQN
jgi:hypothetical protein